MKKPIALMLLLASTLTVAACGTDEPTSSGGGGGSSANAPTPAEMLTKAITETTNQKSAAFQVIANVSGASDDPQIKPFLEKPIKVDISGKGSPTAVDVSGKANVGGQDYQMAARANEAKTFIQFMNTWYGPEDGIKSTTQSTGTDPAELKQALLKLRQYGNDVLKGEVTEGDEVDGQKTWKFTGGLNPDGIVKVAEAEGKPMSADDQAGLRAIAPLVKLTFSTGQEDGLFREFGMKFALNEQQIKVLNSASSGSSPVPLKALAVDFTLKLSDYGTDVKIEEPANPQPTKALGGALLGAFFSMTG
ncbi:hypothetical protein [Solirubrobacter soli]|uniref:hypothetical protein n=1 Tax=Solirubrobacter soli TaxID=363832 RepID=UPI0004166B9D|nr:hypothetical protein [Solirubrobacter soli]